MKILPYVLCMQIDSESVGTKLESIVYCILLNYMSLVLNGVWQSKLGPTLNQTRVKTYEPLLDLNLNQPL